MLSLKKKKDLKSNIYLKEIRGKKELKKKELNSRPTEGGK